MNSSLEPQRDVRLPAKKILIIYNARSGHRRVNFKSYLQALAERGAQVEMRMIGRDFNLVKLLEDAKVFDRVVVAGGDGTAATAAGILQKTGIAVMAYPGGTANLLARNLNIPSEHGALAELTLNGPTVQADLGELEYIRYYRSDRLRQRFLKRTPQRLPVKIYFTVMAGCGFAARLMSEARPLKPAWGEAAYWISALWNFFPRNADFVLHLDGREVRVRGIAVLVVNFAKIQFDIKLVSGGDSQDGKFEVVVLKARSLFGLVPVLWSAVVERLGFKRHAVPEVMETYHAAEIEVRCNPPLKLQFDGEMLKKTSGFRIRACRRAALFVHG